MAEEKIYISLLVKTLQEKLVILKQILEISKSQEEMLKNFIATDELLEVTFSDKSALIEKVNDLDNGFESLYQRVKKELVEKPAEYQKDILELQNLVKVITDYNVQLLAVEQRNKRQFEGYFASKRKEIKGLKVSNNTALNYYKNMMKQSGNESCFLDKIK